MHAFSLFLVVASRAWAPCQIMLELTTFQNNSMSRTQPFADRLLCCAPINQSMLHHPSRCCLQLEKFVDGRKLDMLYVDLPC